MNKSEMALTLALGAALLTGNAIAGAAQTGLFQVMEIPAPILISASAKEASHKSGKEAGGSKSTTKAKTSAAKTKAAKIGTCSTHCEEKVIEHKCAPGMCGSKHMSSSSKKSH